jgi:hypothetical protein
LPKCVLDVRRDPKADFKPSIELVDLAYLRPTQMAVGMRSVRYKRRKIEHRRAGRIEKVLAGRPIPAVLGPHRQLFMIDHHHFGLALWQADVSAAYVQVIDDRSRLGQAAFLKSMEADGRLYPYDEDGQRVGFKQLPTTLCGLRNDPFRDLAWEVREAGGYRKSRMPYAEFLWANFFRERISLASVQRNYDGAIAKAMKLTRHAAARDLPGFLDCQH